nr:hypothetical protein [uncultured Oscillibacter sp.]
MVFMAAIIAQARILWQGRFPGFLKKNAIARVSGAGKGEMHKKPLPAFPASPNFPVLRIFTENSLAGLGFLWYFDISQTKARRGT